MCELEHPPRCRYQSMSDPMEGSGTSPTITGKRDSPESPDTENEAGADQVFQTPQFNAPIANQNKDESFRTVHHARKRHRGHSSPQHSPESSVAPKKSKENLVSMDSSLTLRAENSENKSTQVLSPVATQKQNTQTNEKTTTNSQSDEEIESIWTISTPLPTQEQEISANTETHSQNPIDSENVEEEEKSPHKSINSRTTTNNRPITSRTITYNRNVPPTFHKFPVVIQDLGTGPASIGGLGPSATVKLWANSPVGQILSQRQLASDRWLIGCFSAEQQNKLVHLRQLAQIPIQCSIPTETTEGVIKNIPLSQDLGELRPLIPHAKSVFRLNNKDGSASKAVKITFQLHSLPKTTIIGYQEYQVFPYVAPVARCQHCNRFGHNKKTCKTKKQTCARCSQSGHSTPDCKAVTPRCINCKGAHSAAYLGCPEYKLRQKANKIRAENFIPYASAMNRAKLALAEQAKQKQLAPPSPPPELDPVWRREAVFPAIKTYASVAGGSQNNKNQRKTSDGQTTNKQTNTQNPTNSKIPPPTTETDTTTTTTTTQMDDTTVPEQPSSKNKIKKPKPQRRRLLSVEATKLRKKAYKTRQTLTRHLTDKRVHDLVAAHIEKTTKPLLDSISQQLTALQQAILNQPTIPTTSTPPSDLTSPTPYKELNELQNTGKNKSRGETFLTQILCHIAKARTACKPTMLLDGINSLLPPALRVPPNSLSINGNFHRLAELACGAPGEQTRAKSRATSQSHKQNNANTQKQ